MSPRATSLRAAAEVSLGRQRSPQHEFGTHMVPYLRAANVKDGRLDLTDIKQMNFTPTEQQIFSLRAGDVLITEGSGSLTSVGASAVWLGELKGVVCFQNTLLRMRPRDGITDGRFLEWWARHAFGSGIFASVAGGANIWHISAERVRALPISLPSLDEQRRIADFLDTETSRIDQLREKRHLQASLLEERREACLSWAVSFAGAGSYVHQIVGSISKAWPVLPLRRVVPAINVGVVINPSTYFVDAGVPFIHGFNVRTGRIDPRGMKFMSNESNKELQRSQVRSGDVLVVRAGAPGRSAVVPAEYDGANCASVLILRRGTMVLPEFLSAFINSPAGRGQVRVAQYGAAQEVISAGQTLAFQMPVPDLEEQRVRTTQLNGMLAELDRLANRLEVQESLLAERRQALITAAVTGQFDVSTASGRGITDGVTEGVSA